MKNKRIIIIILAMLFGLQHLTAQTPDSTTVNTDSVNAKKLEAFNKKIQEIEKQRVEDSVTKAKLEEKLNSLTTTDNLQKEELQKQIAALNQKEANRLAQKKAQIDSLKKTAQGYPVLGFFKDTLFVVYSKLGSFSAEDRAAAIHERLEKLKGKFNFRNDSLQIVEGETTIDVVYKEGNQEKTIVSISESDALWNNSTRSQLAENYKTIIGNAVKHYRSEISVVELAKEIGLAILVLLILIGVIVYLGKFFQWIGKKIIGQRDKTFRGIKIKNYTLFDSYQQIKALLTVATVVKWFLVLLAIYIALPILFGIFPWTENFATVLFGYILSPVKKIILGIWNYLPNLITIIVIIVVFRYVLKALAFLKMEIETGRLHINGFYPDWANPTHQIIKVLVYAFMLIVIFPYLPGSDSPVFRGVSVFLGFLFTFGSAGSLSNIIAGLVLTYMRLFKLGDRVKFGEVVGDVIEKSMLVTRIRTIKNEIISIPNSTVMNSHTINYSSDAPERGLILHTTVTIGYDVPWKKMYDALLEAADRTELLLKDPPPFVLQTSLEDFYVAYQINAYTNEPNKQAIIYSNLHQNIQDVCNESGIEILSPHYRAARDGNSTTIPADYLPRDYKSPAFNVNVHSKKTDDN